jgi:DNA-nicking Smr family endonuclease
MEGSLYRQAPPDITERLHDGDFSVQDHIDLHGLTLEEGGKELEMFFSDATTRGLRMVLVIHGRGKSSPAKPVLKSLVREWLTTGPYRTWVIAFASARLCDGGAGATYVLLRHRPLTKRHKKSGKGNA